MSDLLDERNIDVIEITDQSPVIKVSLPANTVYPINIDIENRIRCKNNPNIRI